jgi:hypothetical protein
MIRPDTARIDLASLDRSQFKLTPQGGRVLVHPLSNKRRWEERELPLRSLVTDEDGAVLSAGFPKFFNYGEHAPHDERFVDALARGVVEFPEKLDGSLIVADLSPDGRTVNLRTRQSLGLNELEAPIERLITERYPRLREALAEDPSVREGHSVLFEFLYPERPVVLRYERAALVLLALVDKRSLLPSWTEPALARIARETGVERTAIHALPTDPVALRPALDAIPQSEGVVARAVDRDGRPLLIKIKTQSYLRLHAHRARLGGGNAQRVAFLLGSEDEASFAQALEARGMDYEAITFARENLGDYFERRARVLSALRDLRASLGVGDARPSRADKRAFVERARAFIESNRERFVEPTWFDVAIKLFEGRVENATIVAYSALVGEPGPTVRQWLANAEDELRQTFEREVREEE